MATSPTPFSQVVSTQPASHCQPDRLTNSEQNELRLLGKLMGKSTSRISLDCILDSWKLEGKVVTKDLGAGFFLFSFSLKSDFIRAWSQGILYTDQGQCILVRKWCPGLKLDIEIMSHIQIWMQLPNLDGEYYKDNEKIVCLIASSAGQPIVVDASGDVIRVCVEIDINKPLVSAVKVEDGEGGFLQWFRYEVPGFCFSCGRLDHKRAHCSHPCTKSRGKNHYGSHNLALTREHKTNPRVRYFSWHRPSVGWVKLNFDGSYKPRTGRAGGGGLLRDAKGTFISAFSVPLSKSNALMSEIGALGHGLKLALKLGVKSITIEGDSKITVDLVTGKRTPKGVEENYMMTCIHGLLKCFERINARHEFREANRSADHLANMGAQANASSKEWRHHPPRSLLSFLLHDQQSRVVPRLFS